MRSLLPLAVLLLLASSLTGCVRRVLTMPPGAPTPSAEELPPGTVELNVIPEENTETWDVVVANEVVCQTPCKQRVSAGTQLLLRGPGGDAAIAPRLVDVAPQARRALVIAEGSNEAELVNGIVFTTLGGMGLVTAITLTAVGCSDTAKHGGMCTAGLITGGVSAPLTAISIWMMVDSGARAHLLPVLTSDARPGETPVRVAVLPTGVVGTF